MAIKGSLKEASLPDVIQLLSMGRKTGILSVTDRNDFGNVYLNQGKIVYATIVNRMDRIGDLLIRDGKLTVEQLNAAIQRQGEDQHDKKLGTILVEMNLISEDEIKKYLKIQIEETISHLLSWTDGFFNFEPNTTLTTNELTVSLSSNDLLMEGVRRVDEWRAFRKNIQSSKQIPRFNAGYHLDQLTVEEEIDRTVLQEVNGVNSIEDLIRICRLDEFTICKSLHRYIERGAIEMVDPDQVVEAPAIQKVARHQLAETLNLATAFFKSEMYQEAYREYQKVLELDPQHLGALFHLGLIAYFKDKHDSAIEFYQKAIEIAPHSAKIYNNLGLAYEKTHVIPQALAAYQKAITLDATYARAYYNLGFLQYQQELYDAAVENLKQAIEHDKTLLASYFYLALALMKLGKFDYALMWFKRILEMDAENAIIHNNLGVLYQYKHMHEEASKHYQEAIRLNPSLAIPHSNLGDLYYRGGWHEKAEVEFKRALDLNPKLPGVYFKMGNISLKNGQRETAVKYWEEALKYDPDNTLIQKNLKMIQGTS
ncbi:MAG: tetratricopeptide repeat protein [Gemmatimonadetes bacterium]|nr:MAG: tetratricopeptide repeat protein [Gemmatimonadota bacterium]